MCRNSFNKRKTFDNGLLTTNIDVHQTIKVLDIYNKTTAETIFYLPLSQPMVMTIGNRIKKIETPFLNQIWANIFNDDSFILKGHASLAIKSQYYDYF